MKFSLEHCKSINQNLLPIPGLLLAPYIETLKEVAEMGDYSVPESSINVPFDEDILMKVENLIAEKVTDELRYVFLVGIGGSNLGTKAVYEALPREMFASRTLLCIDTINDARLHEAQTIITEASTSAEILIVSISKSGGTTETIANTEIIIEMATQKWGSEVLERVVVITDEGSVFADTAQTKGIAVLTLPPIIGGRFSMFTAVGLFPLAALGVSITELLQGAQEVRRQSLNPDIMVNPAAQSALVAYQCYQHGQMVHDTFVFNPELESLGKWYRQLLGESLGKAVQGEGDTARVGFVPTVSVGSTDLHSVAQLYLGGPARTLTTFIHANVTAHPHTSPAERVFPDLAPMIAGKTTAEIMEAILQGTKTAYNNQALPFMEIVFDDLTPFELGAFMQFKMMEIMYLGRLFGVDAFSQPAVELYKVETKKILEKN